MTTEQKPEYSPAQCAKSLFPDECSPCRFCHQIIQWGLTVNGKRAPFDLKPPHPNHWITCPKQAEARKEFPRR